MTIETSQMLPVSKKKIRYCFTCGRELQAEGVGAENYVFSSFSN